MNYIKEKPIDKCASIPIPSTGKEGLQIIKWSIYLFTSFSFTFSYKFIAFYCLYSSKSEQFLKYVKNPKQIAFSIKKLYSSILTHEIIVFNVS